MELTLIAIVGVSSIVAVAALASRIGIAAPMILVVVGIGLSFLPGVPRIEVGPEVILTGVLPPLLYATAVHMPAHDFRRDIKAIGGLAVLLVAVSTWGGGLLFSRLLPGLGLAAAFALGAIISPTDAVAATAVGKRLGLPSRLLTILEGEGLVNDASSLVLLSSAIGAMTGAAVPWKIGGKFRDAVVGGIVIGLGVGWISVWGRSILAERGVITALSFAVPFLAYLPAEELHASGVLAVVATGLVVGHQSPRYLKANDRLAEATNWATVAFLLESGLFLFMGLQLKTLLDQAGRAGLSVGTAVWVGLVASPARDRGADAVRRPAGRCAQARRETGLWPGSETGPHAGPAGGDPARKADDGQGKGTGSAAHLAEKRGCPFPRGREPGLARRRRTGLVRHAGRGHRRRRPDLAGEYPVPPAAADHRLRRCRDDAARPGADPARPHPCAEDPRRRRRSRPGRMGGPDQ